MCSVKVEKKINNPNTFNSSKDCNRDRKITALEPLFFDAGSLATSVALKIQFRPANTT